MRGVVAVGVFAVLLAASGLNLEPVPSVQAAVPAGMEFYAFATANFAPDWDCDCTAVTAVNPTPSAATVTLQVCSGAQVSWPVASGASAPAPVRLDNMVGTGFTSAAVARITSSVGGIGVQQQGDPPAESYTSDASQLLPVAQWGRDYLVPGYDESPVKGSFLAVVADAPVTVTVTPSVATTAGGGIPAIAAGTPWTTTLAGCQGFHIVAADDLVGTTVTASVPVGVFAGNECTRVVGGACDHLEEQLWPTTQAGTAHVACPLPERHFGAPSRDLVRVTALPASGVVTLPTLVEGFGQPELLMPGESIDREIQQATAISASQPVLVTQFALGAMAFPSSMGDPAMTQVEPLLQHANSHAFHTYADAWAVRFATVAGPVGTSVSLDGEPAQTILGGASFSTFTGPGGEFGCLGYYLQPGYHSIVSSQPTTVQHGAFYCFNAYLMPAVAAPDNAPAGTGSASRGHCADPYAATGSTVDQCRSGSQSGYYMVTHGNVDGSPGRQAACYDHVTAEWFDLPDALVERAGAAAAGIGDDYYVVGGWDDQCQGPGFTCPEVEVFNTFTSTWQVLPFTALPVPVVKPGVFQDGSRLFVFGGRPCVASTACAPFDGVQIYDPATNTWNVVQGMGVGRSNVAGLARVGPCHIAVAGGNHLGTTLASVERFDDCAAAWDPPGSVSPMPFAAQDAASPGLGTLCVLGGWANGQHVERRQVYDAFADTWSTLSDSSLVSGYAASQAGYFGGTPIYLARVQHDDEIQVVPSC